MKRTVALALLVALAGCLFLVPAFAADDRDDKDTNKGVSDQQFAQKASAAGLAEVNLANLALQRASSPQVKEFAQHMVADHTKANQQLIQMANRKNIVLPATMDRKHQDLDRQLGQLRGAEFDRAYMKAMVADHKEAVSLFEGQSKNGKDSDLKELASTTLPTLREHLKMAQDIQDKVGGGTGSGGERNKGGDRDQGGDRNKSSDRDQGGDRNKGGDRDRGGDRNKSGDSDK